MAHEIVMHEETVTKLWDFYVRTLDVWTDLEIVPYEDFIQVNYGPFYARFATDTDDFGNLQPESYSGEVTYELIMAEGQENETILVREDVPIEMTDELYDACSEALWDEHGYRIPQAMERAERDLADRHEL